ncbi:beta-lactamase/D-alanine carboxypeptidase [Roseovarius albus]|uniref:Beta-lactamase/D-alanine carboxypeptidase n=1 Tax=Roseovarius albus TaxID=1247867 RepID=A0A1X6Z6P3_9RHOB|nr:serine hydrolase domain-containing protein [Roseovarius albus]SLN41934.1 beta-lactamase/D-alanine carboxypeptidase [Roseovarius albus]
MINTRGARLRWAAALVIIAVIIVLTDRRHSPSNIEDTVATFLQVHNIPGAVLAYGAANTRPKVVAFGVSDPLKNTAMLPEQSFYLASVTKPIAATLLIEKAKKEQIDLDRPIAKLIDLPKPYDPRAALITPRHLLAHRGGFDWTISFDPIFAPERVGLDNSSSCAEVAKATWQTMPLDHDPGSKTAYSNVGFCLLSDLLAPNQPENLDNKLLENAGVNLYERAGLNWEFDGEGWTPVQNTEAEQAWISELGIAGGAVGNANSVWYFASAPKPLFKNSSPDDQSDDFYASGWHVWMEENGQHLTHWGALKGIFTTVFRFSDDETVVILFNGSPESPRNAFSALHSALLKINNLARR